MTARYPWDQGQWVLYQLPAESIETQSFEGRVFHPFSWGQNSSAAHRQWRCKAIDKASTADSASAGMAFCKGRMLITSAQAMDLMTCDVIGILKNWETMMTVYSLFYSTSSGADSCAGKIGSATATNVVATLEHLTFEYVWMNVMLYYHHQPSTVAMLTQDLLDSPFKVILKDLCCGRPCAMEEKMLRSFDVVGFVGSLFAFWFRLVLIHNGAIAFDADFPA